MLVNLPPLLFFVFFSIHLLRANSLAKNGRKNKNGQTKVEKTNIRSASEYHRPTSDNKAKGTSTPSFNDNDLFPMDSMSSRYLPPPPCLQNQSQIAKVNHQISATQTFYNCYWNIGDPSMIATFYNGTYHSLLFINNSITLNNLNYIDEIQETAAVQFSLKLYWQDDRYAMPIFWDSLPKTTQSYGIDLTDLLVNTSIAMWIPDIRFPDATDLAIETTYLKLNASNVFNYGLSISVTLQESDFYFGDYPEDSQTIAIRFSIFNYNSDFLRMGFVPGNPIIFNEAYDGSDTFQDNSIWTYDSSSYSSYVSSTGSSYAIYFINVTRQGQGIIFRFVLPITLLLLLAGLSFWIIYDHRVDTTITLLLAVSALYIVILGNIPLVGYATTIDKYVFTMFFLLVVVTFMHQLYATLSEKKERWPLRPIFLRFTELVGRTFVIPFTIFYFLVELFSGIDPPKGSANFLIAVTCICTTFLILRELGGLKKVTELSIIELTEKLNNPETTVADISIIELLLINWLKFGKLSVSTMLVAELLKKGKIEISNGQSGVTLKNLAVLAPSNKTNELMPDNLPSSTGSNPLHLHRRRLGLPVDQEGVAMQTFKHQSMNLTAKIDVEGNRQSINSVVDVDSDDDNER